MVALAGQLQRAYEDAYEPRRQMFNQTVCASRLNDAQTTLHLLMHEADADAGTRWLAALDGADALTAAGVLLRQHRDQGRLQDDRVHRLRACRSWDGPGAGFCASDSGESEPHPPRCTQQRTLPLPGSSYFPARAAVMDVANDDDPQRTGLVEQIAHPTSETELQLPDLLADLDIAGGVTYDALVALAARDHVATLATLDARARGTYEIVGVTVVLPG